MKIERLLFQVRPPDFSKDFLQVDAEVWNPWLQRQPGFLNKTSRIMPQGMVELLIYWRSQKDLDNASSKKKELKVVESLMRARSPGRFHLVSSSVI